MSWSGDPRLPKPDVNPEVWCKFWENQIEMEFNNPDERLVKDENAHKYMLMVSEQHLTYLYQVRLEIATNRRNICNIWLMFYSVFGASIEQTWASKTRKEREKVMMDALAKYATCGVRPIADIEEIWWLKCPDVTIRDMCSGKGEGFIRLMNHLKGPDALEKPSLDFPVLMEPRVWRLYDISMDDAANARRPEGVRGYHNKVIVDRHWFLTHFVINVLLVLTGRDFDGRQYVRIPKVKETSDFKDRVKAGQDLFPLPDHVHASVEAEGPWERIPKAERTMPAPKDRCTFCEKEADKAQLKFCSGCNKIGRRVFYCSRECQVKDYKEGRPPHKKICSKPLRETPLDFSGSNESTTKKPDDIKLYTFTPSSALSLQLYYLRQDKFSAHYNFIPIDDDPYVMSFAQPIKSWFLEARKNAMEKRDLGSIGLMDFLLSAHDPYKDGNYLNYTPQLEKEYEVDMAECRMEAFLNNGVYRMLKEIGVDPKRKLK